eukprot:TRINITY_DN9204_c0_g3_i4.p1 TRINITY_DN9204_c0_g3~~TRINITY_DN9204_c0_g3_i4.p1  ORF type:complete len:446 (-),score=94.00 TRINITY_DN9204_c0_g3_i4:70-1407(-)
MKPQPISTPYKHKANSPATLQTKDSSIASPAHDTYSAPSRNSNTIRAIVQEMIRKRKEQRKGLKTGEGNASALLESPLKEKTLSVGEELKSTGNDLSRDVDAIERSNFETVKVEHKSMVYDRANRNYKPSHSKNYNQTLKNRRQNVFDRLYASATHKLSEERLSSPNTTNTRFKKQRSSNSIKVEDRLLEYKKKKEEKLVQKRAEVVKAELSQVLKSPRILPHSQVSQYGSLLERFDALEKKRLRKLTAKAEQKISEEMKEVRRVPEINGRSRSMARGVDAMLDWELRRKQRVEMGKHQRDTKEMEQMVADKSVPMVAPSTQKYLARMGRDLSSERVENRLIRYGQNSKAKAKQAAETPKHSFTPAINDSSYRTSLYVPFSPHGHFANVRDEVEREYALSKEERTPRKTFRASKNKLVKGLCRAMEDELYEDPHELQLPKFVPKN